MSAGCISMHSADVTSARPQQRAGCTAAATAGHRYSARRRHSAALPWAPPGLVPPWAPKRAGTLPAPGQRCASGSPPRSHILRSSGGSRSSGSAGKAVRAAAARGAAAAPLAAAGAAGAAGIDIAIEPGPSNSRCIWAGVDVAAPAAAVFAALTAYEQLDAFIPGLAENRCLERFPDGCRLQQVGAQELALGLKFRARVLLRIREFPQGMPPRMLSLGPSTARRAEARGRSSRPGNGDGAARQNGWLPLPPGLPSPWGSGWGSSSGSSGSEEEAGAWGEWRFLQPRSPLVAPPCSDISFELVEGDFAAFKGLWRMQPVGPGTCRLSYSLFVRPQPWLLVGLIEKRIGAEIGANLAAVKCHVERQVAPGGA